MLCLKDTPEKGHLEKSPLCICCPQLVPQRHLKYSQLWGELVCLASPSRKRAPSFIFVYREGLRLLSTFRDLQRRDPILSPCPAVKEAASQKQQVTCFSEANNQSRGKQGEGGRGEWQGVKLAYWEKTGLS